jgi:hypothetical protein
MRENVAICLPLDLESRITIEVLWAAISQAKDERQRCGITFKETLYHHSSCSEAVQ